MTEPLSLSEVVDILVEMDLVDLDGASPWPGNPEGSDVYEPDWAQVHPTASDVDEPFVSTTDPSTVVEEVQRRAAGGFRIPPPDILDGLAWYTPIHFFGLGSAIYVRESAVLDVAAAILNRLPESQRRFTANVMGACRAAMSVLYLHEAYHHKIESLAIRFEAIERTRRYLPYSERVYVPLIKQGSDDVFEETLACAEMYRRFASERLYRRGVPASIRDATLAMLPEWFCVLPPSYREAGYYLNDMTFDSAQCTLMSQVHEAAISTRRAPREWDLAPHLCRGLFNCQRITHVLVPIGQQPILPWIGHSPALPSVSSRRLIRYLEDRGWVIEPGRGKGSHVRLRQVGKPSLTIPANRESLSPPVLKSVAKALGVRVGELTAKG
ncbi:type II toxin-antitoxin system HicA family toxin [Mycobacterium sp. Z3061]|uniref:type II toxin-antitoxin system HicA family toxin n=1 Tax=Mycobacterium sp. Z3061 TaxID=3073562 RepID=UPI002873CFB8|nr:type II toxin-antitoxin system HicA family toxin [Mycobacterium sp. Z3061]